MEKKKKINLAQELLIKYGRKKDAVDNRMIHFGTNSFSAKGEKGRME